MLYFLKYITNNDSSFDMKYSLVTLVITMIPIFGNTLPLIEKSERFQPVYSQSGMVATQEENATRVGVDILKSGGNAIDAAVAVGFALAVTLPRAGNLGGGGFMIIKMNADPVVALNYREKAPMGINKDILIARGSQKMMNEYMSSGVPGTVAGLLWAHDQYGNLPREKVMMPAIKLARDGFIVNY